MRNLLLILLLFFISDIYAQDSSAVVSAGESDTVISEEEEFPEMLLTDLDIQIKATDAVNNMYNFKFEDAEEEFLELKSLYPDHPLPYFLMGLSTWWKIVPNNDVTIYDDRFMAYMDTSIAKAEALYDQDEKNLEAAFFLAAAYGLVSEHHGNRGRYLKSAFIGKSALNYFNKTMDHPELSPEFLYGTAIINYYEPWIRDEYPMLTPLLLLFPKGDKDLGIKQLKQVSYNAFYTRTEAQYKLLRIYDDENDYWKGLQVARYLTTTFPDNPYFTKMHAKFSYHTSQLKENKKVSESMLKKVEEGYPGFGDYQGRLASFFLAEYYRHREPDTAMQYYTRSIDFAEKSGHMHTTYTVFSMGRVAENYENNKEYDKALQYYKMVKKYGRYHKGTSLYKKAKEKIKELKDL